MLQYPIIFVIFINTIEITPWATWLTTQITGWHWTLALLVALPISLVMMIVMAILAALVLLLLHTVFNPGNRVAIGLSIFVFTLMTMVVHVPMLARVLHQWQGWQGSTLYVAAFGAGLLLSIIGKLAWLGIMYGLNFIANRPATPPKTQLD